MNNENLSRVERYDNTPCRTNMPVKLAHNWTLDIVLAVIALFVLSNVPVVVKIMTIVAGLIGYYAIAVMVLLVLEITHHDNGLIGRVLGRICEPALSWVYNYGPWQSDRYQVTYIITILLLLFARFMILVVF